MLLEKCLQSDLTKQNIIKNFLNNYNYLSTSKNVVTIDFFFISVLK